MYSTRDYTRGNAWKSEVIIERYRNTYNIYIRNYINYIRMYWYALLVEKRKSNIIYVAEISTAVGKIDDVNQLDRILSRLMQTASSSKTCQTDHNTESFQIKDHFVSMQKNETQLQFNKTTTIPRRKSKPTLVYVQQNIWMY